MACITKLAGGFAYDCDTGSTGIESALIINKGDIASFVMASDGGPVVTGITLNSGASAYKIDTPKRSLVISESLKINEGAPNGFSQSAVLVATEANNDTMMRKIISISNGSFVIACRRSKNDFPRIYGLYYGLSATNIERSTHDNGSWFTITLETPEQFIGEDGLVITGSAYNTLYNGAVY